MTRPRSSWTPRVLAGTTALLGALILGLLLSTPAGGARLVAPEPVGLAEVGEPEVLADDLPVIATANAPAEPVQPPAASVAETVGPPVADNPCLDSLAWVEEAGLRLPPGVGYHCPSAQFNHHGAACWNAWPCPGHAFIAINLDLIGDAGPKYLRHVVAHEILHILEFRATGGTTERSADACAAAHGAP